jgi:LysM repeat protein
MNRFLFKQKPVKRRQESFFKKEWGKRMHKSAGWLCLGVFLFGAALLVSYAINSPELPPENLLSTLDDVSDYYKDPDNSYSSSVVILPSAEEQNWASLSTLNDAGTQTGAGTQEADRTKDIEYHIRPGETLSEIAYSYNVPYDLLAFYNNISNVNRIQVGTIIRIPSFENMKTAGERLAKQPVRAAAAPRQSTKSASIAFESRNNGNGNGYGITVQFSIVDPPEETLQSFEWDFGDGKRGFRPSPSYEYTVPKTYVARLTARDTAGVIYKSNPLYIDVPHPGSVEESTTTKFVTLSSPEDFFVVNGTVTEVARYADVASAPLDFSESDQFLTKVRFKKPGYYGLTVTDSEMIEQYYSVFVSPIPTMHADVSPGNFNWYRTQYNTGTSSNCGPAVASMAIGWSLGKYVSVASVRETIGWQGNGGTSFEDFLRVVRGQRIPAAMKPLRSVQDIKDVIDSGNIAVILFHTQGISTASSNPEKSLFGKYYNDSVGHYIVIKGYSLNGEFFVVYDPIPNDWTVNSFRYGDELSMIGRNRYYSSREILQSLRRYEMMVVPKMLK